MPLVNDLSGLIFPNVCVCCEVVLTPQEEYLCLPCLADLPEMYQLESFNPVKRLFDGKINLEYATAFLEFEQGNKTQQIVHELKYNGNPGLAKYMGRLMGQALFPTIKKLNVNAVIPVPLHYKKQIIRGYNQADEIAVGLSKSCGIELRRDLIKRKGRTKSQTKKTRYDRWRNVSAAFYLKKGIYYNPNHLLLVDDVVTTGATIEACASCLRKQFACKISAVSLARAA